MAAIELFSTPLYTDANLNNYFRFEGASTDSKANATTSDSNITYATGNGKFNQGAGFNGTNSRITLTGSILDPGSTSFSISTWVNMPASGNARDHGVIVKASATNPFKGYQLACASTTGLYFIAGDTSGTQNITIDPITGFTADGNWHHLAIVVDRTNSKAYTYVDGVVKDNGIAISNTNSISVGDGGLLGVDRTGSNFASFKLDDLAYFNRVLTATEISNIYNGTWGTGGGLLLMGVGS